jgi:hypothetical protein
MKTVRMIWMGLGNLPGYGPHPGIPAMALLTVMPLVACEPLWWLVAVCEAVIWGTLGVGFLIGAYERARGYLRSVQDSSQQ